MGTDRSASVGDAAIRSRRPENMGVCDSASPSDPSPRKHGCLRFRFHPDERDALTNFIIVGAGPSGVETAGALAEFRSHILKRDYPDLDIENMRIYLVQSGDTVLKGMSDYASTRALADLREMGVEVLLGSRVRSYDGKTVFTEEGLELRARALI